VVEVSGYDQFPTAVKCGAAPPTDCLIGVVLHTAVEQTGRVDFPLALTVSTTTTPTTIDGSHPLNNQPPTNAALRTPMASTLDAIHKAVVRTQLSNLHSLPTDCPTREKRGWMGDAQWTAEEATLNFDMHALYTNFVQSMIDVQTRGCYPTKDQYALEPPYGTCCSPTLDPVHPTIFQCSPYSNSSDAAGSVPDVVPMLWGTGGGRGFPGAPVWGTAIVVIPDAVRARYTDNSFLSTAYPHLQQYMAFLKRQAKFAPGRSLPQFGLLGDWLSLDPMCPGGSDACLKTPGWISGNPTTSFYYLFCTVPPPPLVRFLFPGYHLFLILSIVSTLLPLSLCIREHHCRPRSDGSYCDRYWPDGRCNRIHTRV
jgi:hypothetical protein